MLLKEATVRDAQPQQAGLSSAREHDTNLQDRDSLFFKNDCMYKHHLARFNYTTYDARRAQDVINPGTCHRDVMLLANNTDPDASSDHHFLYARVLGIYHANVVYTGADMLDYNPRKIYFLWVRWIEHNGSRSSGWESRKLDSVSFPPMATEGAFGFVDPKDVLRGCHIIPAFAKGKARLDNISLSRHVKDAEDWYCYYVNRYAAV